MDLRLIFYISKGDSTYDAKMDSPDQKVFGIQASVTNFENSTLYIEIEKLGIRYQGQYKSNGIEGFFYQSGQSFPLNLARSQIEKKAFVRPQEPRMPYPYFSEEVMFANKGGKKEFAEILTSPNGKNKFPATDTNLAFILLLARPGISGNQILLKQAVLLTRAQGMDEESVEGQSEMSRSAFELFREDESFECRLKECLDDVISSNNIIAEGIDRGQFKCRSRSSKDLGSGTF